MKKTTIAISVLAVVSAVALYGIVYQGYKNSHMTTELESVKKELNIQAKKNKALNNENQTLSTQLSSYKKDANNAGKSSSELEFNTVTNKYLDTMFNFEPDTYNKRKDSMHDIISDKLYQQYFPKNQNFGDSNNVSSKLDNATIYTQSQQGSDMKGLAVVTYESKSGDNDWRKSTEMYQIKFDTTKSQITDVQNLGSSFEAKNVK